MARFSETEWKAVYRSFKRKMKQLPYGEALALQEYVENFPFGRDEGDSEGDYIEPIPLPEYPEDVIGPLGELVAARGTIPAPYLAGAGLGALAAMCPRAEVVVGSRRPERPILWIPIIGETGSAKTPALDIAFGPVRRVRTNLEREAARLHQAREEIHKRLVSELDDETKEDQELRGKLIEEELDKLFPPETRSASPIYAPVLANDTTPEALISLLEDRDGVASIVADELKISLRSLGSAYSRDGSAGSQILQLWSGVDYAYFRKTNKERLIIANPTLTIVGNLTPSGMKLLGPAEDGLRPRFLPHIAPAQFIDEMEDAETPHAWFEVMIRLQDKIHKRRRWELSDKARDAWNDAREDWRRMRHSSEPEIVIAALAKADVHALRIALVLAESLRLRSRVIPMRAMQWAIAIVDYTLDCWRAKPDSEPLALGHVQAKRQGAVAELVDWLQGRPERQAPARDILRYRVAGITDADTRDRVLTEMQSIYGPHVIDPPMVENVKVNQGRIVYDPSWFTS